MTIKALYPNVRPTLNLDFAKTKALDPRVTFTRASTGTFVGANGLIQTAASGAARFDHNPATGESLGLLVEEARTNLALYSEQFDNGYWLKGNCTITPNATTAPDGAITADRLVEDTVNNSHVVNTSITLSIGTAYTLSTYVKAAGRTFAVLATFGTGSAQRQFFNLTTGQAVNTISGITPSITALPNGWYRIGISFTAAVSSSTEYIGAAFSDSVFAYTGDGASGIYIWGAQLETGSFPTSYIPTTTATVTRAADVASMTGTNFSSWYNQSEGTLFNDFISRGRGPSNVAYPSVISASGNTSNWFAGAISGGGTASVQAYAYVASNSVAWQPFGSVFSNATKIKMALSGESANMAFVTNGGTPLTNSTQLMPINPNQMSLSTFEINGTIARLAYYPVRLPDAQLQALTAT